MRRCRIESIGVSTPARHLIARGSVRHAVTAGRRCLRGSHYHPADVRVLINAGVHRDRHICEPAMAVYIQHRLGINIEFQGRRTLAFDLLNGGCGMLNAVQVVQAQMESGEVQVGMVVASESNRDRRPDPAYPYPASGAALLLDIAPRRDTGFGSLVFRTTEEYADLYTSVVSLAEKRGRIIFRRRTAELEEAWLACATAAVDELLERDRLRRSDIDIVVPAQISPAFLQRLPTAIGFPREQVIDLTASLPDTLSTSTFLALHQVIESRGVIPGRRALLLAFGSGITVGAATYRF